MWVFLNNAFLSIVAHRDKPDTLLVRARRDGDIERVFPDVSVYQDMSADYRYRADIAAEKVASAMADAVNGIGYDNFKGSVKEHDRHDAYMSVWSAMSRFQS